jgi:hypothetical protein
MIAYHAATSERLHRNRFTLLFVPGHLKHTAEPEGEQVDSRPKPLTLVITELKGRTVQNPGTHLTKALTTRCCTA